MTSDGLTTELVRPADNAGDTDLRALFASARLREVLLPFLVTRIVMLLIGSIATRYLGRAEQTIPRGLEYLSRFDGLWYVKIARDGYFFDPTRQSSIAFAPLLPILMRLGGRILGASDDAYVIAGVVISNVSLLIGLLFIRATARELFGDRAAQRAMWYVLICPGTLYLSVVYPMSLMLAIGAGAIWFARHQRWALAGAVGMLAPLARPDGVLLLFPILFEAVRSKSADRRFLWLLMVPAMSALWLCAQWLAFGTPFAFIRAQKMWEPSPFITVFHSPRAALILGTAAFFVLLTIRGWFGLPISCSLYSSLFLAMMLFSGRLWSLPRYSVILFPCFMMLAWLGTRWKWLHIFYLAMATVLAAIFTMRFSLGLWVA